VINFDCWCLDGQRSNQVLPTSEKMSHTSTGVDNFIVK